MTEFFENAKESMYYTDQIYLFRRFVFHIDTFLLTPMSHVQSPEVENTKGSIRPLFTLGKHTHGPSGMTYTHTHTHTQTHIYMYIHVYMYIHMYIHIYMYIHVYISMYTSMYTSMYIHIYVYVYIYIHTYTYIYIHI